MISRRCWRADRQRSGEGTRVERQAGAFPDLEHRRGRARRAKRAASSERNVLSDGHRRHVREMLMNHADTGGHRRRGRENWPRRVAGGDGSGIGAEESERRTDQRRFSGAVFAEQRVHCSATNAKRNVAQRPRGAESLRDVGERQRDAFRPRAVLAYHRPLGMSMNTDVSPKCAATSSPRARTPSVSVA